MSMKTCRLLVLAAAVALPGCMAEYQPAPLPASAGQKAGTAADQSAPQPKAQPQTPAQPAPSASAAHPLAEQPPASRPPGQGPLAEWPPAGQSPGVAPRPSPSASGNGTAAPRSLPIQLSVGIALPQTGPEGTMMGFSVDYQFTTGEPQTSLKYFWIIQRAGGKAARIPVRLEQKGNLALFLPWRPEEGPFQGHLEDGSGNRLSPTIDLR